MLFILNLISLNKLKTYNVTDKKNEIIINVEPIEAPSFDHVLSKSV